jgi:endonuclease/exonuclease/phosphatase family metal-dependent hydrolase
MSFLQIASWNIEHLSGASREEKRQSAFALADHIEMAGIDIIALQEIYVTDAEEEVRLFERQPPIESRGEDGRRDRELDIVCHLLEEHLKDPWRYLILPNRAPGDRSQLCAVLWNANRATRSTVLRIPVQHKVDGMALWDRAPHAVKFTTVLKVWRRDVEDKWFQTDESKSIALIPLHMKSNYGGATKNRRVREKEAQELCRHLDLVREDVDPSLILIGDTNVLKYDEPAIECFVTNKLIDLNNTDGPTYWSREYGDSPFDRAFVAEGRDEFKYSRQYILRSSDLVSHDRLLSDHFMIKVSVKLYLDNADPRPE